MANHEKFANDGIEVLNGAINNSTTSVVVGSAGSFPTAGNFRIRIDDEFMLVTAVSGTTLTVTRGYEGSSAVSHADGATVRQVLTAGVMGQVDVWDEVLEKPSDTGRSTTSIADDTFLVSANTYNNGETIEFEAVIIYDGANTTADFKWGFASSQNMVGHWWQAASDSTSNVVVNPSGGRVSGGATFGANLGTVAGRSTLEVHGLMSFQAGSADFRFQWSTLNGGSTVTLKAGSKLRIRRLATT